MIRPHLPFLAGFVVVVLAGGPSDVVAQKDAKKGAKKLDLDPKARYESVITLYSINERPSPFYNLTVPDGKVLLNDKVREIMRNAKFDLRDIDYEGIAQFDIEADGDYMFETNIEQVRINGREQSFARKGGKVKLKKGVYELRLKEGTYVAPGAILIRNLENNTIVPIYNKGAALLMFVKQHANYQEVSEWDPAKHLLETKSPAKK